MEEELEIFLEDCDDQLQFMENALVEMQNGIIDEEAIGAIFRAVHTIKGSAGMFGFDDIVAFTHTGENLFDLIRQGKVEVNKEMIDLFLRCKDYAEKLVQAAVNSEELDEEQKRIGEELTNKLIAYIEGKPQESAVEVLKDETLDESEQKWHISLRFHQEFFTTGMSINSIFNFFNKMGKVLLKHPITYNIPPLEELNPIHPYIGFEILFSGKTTKEELEDVFEFVADDVDLIIFDVSEKGAYESLVVQRGEALLQKELIAASFASQEMFSETFLKDVSSEESEAEEKKELKKEIIAPQESLEKQEEAKKSESKKKSSTTLRVDSHKIDLLINYMSEIVITNSKILSLVERENEESEESSELEEAAYSMKELLEYVRDGIMDMRMIQVGDSFNKFRRIVIDTAKKIGKDVEFVISGGETELDKSVVERISDPLIHMLRNSIDHGIELPEERVAKGKRAKGRVDLRAYPDAGSIVIEIEDDGGGLDKERILAKAIENGVVKPSDKLSDEEIYKLIFAAGLSTADKVSDISGRGVGMDVVKRNIEDLRGSVDITSTYGVGSKITIRLPLTLAIIDGFLVQVGLTKYIIPLENIKECIELTKEEEAQMGTNEFINLRGEMLPLLNIRDVLHEEESISNRKNIVIVYFGNKYVGLIVDELLGEYQTVIKSLGEVFVNLPGISGGSILGSGEIALIFDVPRLIELKNRVGSVK